MTTKRAPGPDQAPSKARLRLWLRLLKAQKLIESELRDRLRVNFGSTLPRFDVLAALSRADAGLKMSELSGVLRVSNGNVTGIVDRLAKDGMVIRVPVEGDRRAMRVCLTKAGRDYFAGLARVHEGWVDELLSAFSPDEAETLSAQLRQLADDIDPQHKGS